MADDQKNRFGKHSKREKISDEVKDVLEGFLRLLTTEVHAIKVDYILGEKTTQFIVHCHRNDIGKIIGAKGRTITSLRSLVMAMMGQHQMRGVVEIPYFDLAEK